MEAMLVWTLIAVSMLTYASQALSTRIKTLCRTEITFKYTNTHCDSYLV